MKINIAINGEDQQVMAPAKTIHEIINRVKSAKPGKTKVVLTSAYMRNSMERNISSKDRDKLLQLLKGAV